MRGILADVNIQGHVEKLRGHFESEEWQDVWSGLNLAVHTFADVGLQANTVDVQVWQTCQDRQLVLITANRNDDVPIRSKPPFARATRRAVFP